MLYLFYVTSITDDNGRNINGWLHLMSLIDSLVGLHPLVELKCSEQSRVPILCCMGKQFSIKPQTHAVLNPGPSISVVRTLTTQHGNSLYYSHI